MLGRLTCYFRASSSRVSTQRLGPFLSALEKEYHHPRFLSSDPLEFVHQFNDPWDQEAVGLLSALLAYGNVKLIKRAVIDILNRIEFLKDSPRSFVENLSDAPFRKKASKAFEGFIYRFNNGQDILNLFCLLNRSWTLHGSLGNHFLNHLKPDSENISEALSLLLRDWNAWIIEIDPIQNSRKRRSGMAFLLASPENGSACKRWCMFLRWMVRKDPEPKVDLGLWAPGGKLLNSRQLQSTSGVLANQLVMPLDTHTSRISQYLRLTQRKSTDWKTALEVTASLKGIDPEDPVRFDFALARLGILDLCQRTYRYEVCENCQLLTVCHFAQKHIGGS